MTPIRFGIIGYGEAGKAYTAAIDASADAETVATSGPNGDSDIHLHFEDASGVLARGDIDAVIVDCPTALASEVIATALARGRHVLSAGPPGRSPDDAAEIRAALATAPGAILQFASPLANHGSALRAAALLEAGTFGEVLFARCIYGRAGLGDAEDRDWLEDYRASGGGVLMNEGYHLASLIHRLFGEVADVTSMVSRRLPGPHGLEDNAFGLLRMTSGAIVQLHASLTNWRHTFRFEIVCERGYVWIDGLLPEAGGFTPEILISARTRLDDDGAPRPNPAEEVRAFEDNTAIDRTLSAFLRTVRGEQADPATTFPAACAALDIIHRLYDADPAWPRV